MCKSQLNDIKERKPVWLKIHLEQYLAYKNTCWMNDWIILFLLLHSSQETALLICPPNSLRGSRDQGCYEVTHLRAHDRRKNTGLVQNRAVWPWALTLCKTGIKTVFIPSDYYEDSAWRDLGTEKDSKYTNPFSLPHSDWLFPNLNPDETATQRISKTSWGTVEWDE